MDAQLTLLLEIQDLTMKLKELDAGLGAFEREHFGIDPAEAAGRLRAKIEELVGSLAKPVRRGYERIAGKVDRVVVPVIGGLCYGCFVTIPTARARDSDANAALQSCEHCGRFIYILA